MIAEWVNSGGHGLGAVLHIASGALSYAVQFNRVLVYTPKSFWRADHDGCAGDVRRTMECYFFPVTSDACVRTALSLREDRDDSRERLLPPEIAEGRLAGPERVVYLPWTFLIETNVFNMKAAQNWSSPWQDVPTTTEMLHDEWTGHQSMGKRHYDDFYKEIQWWRAQSMQYILRWPTAYLCTLLNRERHLQFGQEVALQVAAIEEGRRRSAAAAPELGLSPEEAGRPASDALDGNGAAWWGSEAYMPRPIVSVHVRQGDKWLEANLFSLHAYMWLANRLRFHAPDLQHVWLSTESERVITHTAAYKSWQWHYTNITRQSDTTSMVAFEAAIGVQHALESALVNLLIASECDYFVGMLGSNWNRLINELRLTNGRFRAGYLTLNFNDW
eukprot:SM000117S25512  [mRNA]  locus=s117:217810:219589:- [translate_table: standard]